MAHNPVRKFIMLTLIYGITIFGIFMLQFRNVSSFSKLFGFLQLRLSYTNSENTDARNRTLKNGFYISGKGITVFSNESSPMTLQITGKEPIVPVLQNWEETGSDSFSLFFSDNVSLFFNGSGENTILKAELPAKTVSLSIPYKTTESYSVTDINQFRAIIKSKREARILQATSLTADHIKLSASGSAVLFAPYEETRAFSFASIAGSDKASAERLRKLTEKARLAIFNDFAAVSAESLNESLVSAFIAESAVQGTYHTAVNSVPASFKEGAKRTYLSAPYFNTLVKMNQTLVMERENILYRIKYSLEKKNLDVFELDRLSPVLLRLRTAEAAPILSLPASVEQFAPNTAQAAGILDLYTILYRTQPANAALLEPVLETCVSILETSCALTESGDLYLKDKDVPANPVLTAKTARALQRYGEIVKDGTIQAAGRLLTASLIQEQLQQSGGTADIKTLADLYPYIAGDNAFYPHIKVIGFENGSPVWAWTAAQNITYAKENGTVVLKTSFMQEESHYMILGGIEPFTSIEIYGLQYRTDPRFETYNSSGYVYSAESKTLFLKFRHKSATETVRLGYSSRIEDSLSTESPAQTEPVENADTENGTEKKTSDSSEAENSKPVPVSETSAAPAYISF